MFRIPFITRDSTPTEHRRAKYGGHRFAVIRDVRKETVCLHCTISSTRESIFIQGGNNQGAPRPLQSTLDSETSDRRPGVTCTCQKPTRTVSPFIILAIIAFPAIVAVTIGNFSFEVTSSAPSALGLRLFTDKFDHFVGPRLQHSFSIRHLNMEASFGFHPDSTSAHSDTNFARASRSIPGLTSPLYSPPLHLDITRVDRTFWKSFSPRPAIHPPEMALSGSNNPGHCWAFAGYSGQLGIQLPVPVRITSLVVEHTWDTSFTESAPRNVVLWGLVPADNIDPHSPSRNTSSPLQPRFGTSYVGTQLASVVFDATQGQPRQTFVLHHTTTNRHFEVVVAQILGNWGHPDYTCLYRLEIYGSPE